MHYPRSLIFAVVTLSVFCDYLPFSASINSTYICKSENYTSISSRNLPVWVDDDCLLQYSLETIVQINRKSPCFDNTIQLHNNYK